MNKINKMKIPSVSNGVAFSLPAQAAVAMKIGWSFWLMTPSFFLSAFAAMVGAAILGCTCVTNKIERERRLAGAPGSELKGGRGGAYMGGPANYGYYSDATDPQVLRL